MMQGEENPRHTTVNDCRGQHCYPADFTEILVTSRVSPWKAIPGKPASVLGRHCALPAFGSDPRAEIL